MPKIIKCYCHKCKKETPHFPGGRNGVLAMICQNCKPALKNG